MDSSNSCSAAAAAAFPTNMSLSLGKAIRDEGKKQIRPTPSASKMKAQEIRTEGAFKCRFCPDVFKAARARGGHQKAHMELWSPQAKKKKKPQEMRIEGAFKCRFCPRSFKTAKSRGGHQKAHRDLPAFKEKKANKVRRPVLSPALRSACLRAQPFDDWHIHYEPSVRPMLPSFPWQTGTSTSSLAVALAGGSRTGDGVRLGRLEEVREVSQEEPADGIDLTLKL